MNRINMNTTKKDNHKQRNQEYDNYYADTEGQHEETTNKNKETRRRIRKHNTQTTTINNVK